MNVKAKRERGVEQGIIPGVNHRIINMRHDDTAGKKIQGKPSGNEWNNDRGGVSQVTQTSLKKIDIIIVIREVLCCATPDNTPLAALTFNRPPPTTHHSITFPLFSFRKRKKPPNYQ